MYHLLWLASHTNNGIAIWSTLIILSFDVFYGFHLTWPLYFLWYMTTILTSNIHFRFHLSKRSCRHRIYDAPGGGGSDACAVCKRMSSMKALQLGRGLVKSTNFHWSILEIYSVNMKLEIWAFPHKETARSIYLGRLLHCGQIDPRGSPYSFDKMQCFCTRHKHRTPPPPPPHNDDQTNSVFMA